MVNFFNWIPGSGLLVQAWDATKLVGTILDRRQERALVLRQENEQRVAQFRGENATKRMKEVIEGRDPEEIARLFLPEKAVALVRTAGEVYWKIWDLYWFFAILRIALVFLPQTGYIHPDEFFQTVEVVSGDVLGLDVTRTWEFNSTSPVRSMVIPMAVYGLPLYALRLADTGLHKLLGINTIVTPYMVLLLPRLAMLAMSFVVDVCVYQVCVIYKHNYNRCLTTLASSYVMLVYSTRTFTNSIELVLVTVLIYLVAHCMKRTSETVYLQSMVQQAYDKADSVREKIDLKKKRKLIPEHDFKHFLPISIICAAGIFNRPTFVAFACVPLFYWFQRGIATDSYFTPFVVFHFRMVSLIPGFVTTGLVFILLDSLYYGDLTLSKLWELEMSWSDWKCTPFHFVMYNVVPGNLDQHGRHPFYTHALVNMALLYGPLGFSALLSALNFFAKMLQNEWQYKPGVRTVYALTMFTFVVSLVLLSAFPHQEPRFLIPLTVPVVLMNAHVLRQRFGGAGGHRPLLTLWYAFNVLLLVVYGFAHQGGVLTTVQHLGKEGLRLQPDTNEINVVFSNTYMPPKFPLLQGVAKKVATRGEEEASSFPRYLANPGLRIQYHDLSGSPMTRVRDKLVSLVSAEKYLQHIKRRETFVVLPAHLINELSSESREGLSFQLVHQSRWPHVSTENLPQFVDYDVLAELLNSDNPEVRLAPTVMEFFNTFAYLRLSVYKVNLGDAVRSVEMKTTRATSA